MFADLYSNSSIVASLSKSSLRNGYSFFQLKLTNYGFCAGGCSITGKWCLTIWWNASNATLPMRRKSLQSTGWPLGCQRAIPKFNKDTSTILSEESTIIWSLRASSRKNIMIYGGIKYPFLGRRLTVLSVNREK
jgi:hypothetical protein